MMANLAIDLSQSSFGIQECVACNAILISPLIATMIHTPFDIRDRDINIVSNGVGTRKARFTHSTQILDRLLNCFRGW